MQFTDEELDSMQICLHDEAFYGDDDVVYRETPYSIGLRSALRKVEDEIQKRRKG